MGCMKIIILGVDGLEYEHVVKYKLSNIMQKQYGKTDLSEFDVVVTPLIWASFLTGKVNREMVGVFTKSLRIRQSFVWSTIRIITKKVTATLPTPIKNRIDKLKIHVTTNPMRKTASYLLDNKIKTILDEFKSWYITIPGYNHKWDTYSSLLMTRAVEELTKTGKFGKASVEYEKYTLKDYFQRKKEFLKSLSEDYQLWFFYTDLIDALLHLFISDKLRVMKYYLEIDRFIYDVHKLAPEDAVIFVISDHGMKKVGRLGDHSDHGFWSSSIYINGFSNPRPTDFYFLWKKFLRGEKFS